MIPSPSFKLSLGSGELDAFPANFPFRSAFTRQPMIRHEIEDHEWDRYRAAITNLYRTQNKRLSEVKRFLKQEYFIAPR